MMADDGTLLSGVSELDAIPPQSQVLTEQRLKYWFKLADPQTRNTFLQWAENNHPPEIFVPVRRLFSLYLAAISTYSNL